MRWRLPRAAWRSRSGSSAAEFAITLVPLMTLVFGVLEFGRLIYQQNGLQELAVETARCAATYAAGCSDGTGVFSATATAAFVQAGATARSVTIVPSKVAVTRTATCGGVSGMSQATLSSAFVTSMPAFLTSLAGGVAINATACYPNQ